MTFHFIDFSLNSSAVTASCRDISVFQRSRGLIEEELHCSSADSGETPTGEPDGGGGVSVNEGHVV